MYLNMEIKIEKKQIVLGCIIIGAIVAVICGYIYIRNSTYSKRLKECQMNIHQIYYMSSILSSEVHTTWRDYIFDDKKYLDKNTGRFYVSRYSMPDSADTKYCVDFSEAIMEKSQYYRKKGVHQTLDSLYDATKVLLRKMTPSPQKYETIHKDISELFHTAEEMYYCAVSPEGNLRSYTAQINQLSVDYKRQSSNIDIQIGEIDSDKKSDFESKALIKFL